MVSKNRRDLIILAVVGLIFFLSTLVLVNLSPTYSSPDETANAFFAETFATQGQLFSFEPFNTVLGDVLFPRSVISFSGRLLPIGFLGLPIIFGFLMRLFGFWSLAFWTPFFAVLAMWAWYGLIRKIFNRQVALFSALLLVTHPAWWYWSGRPLMPNVTFVSFLIFSGFFLVVKPIKFLKKDWAGLDPFLAGLCFSLSLWIRSFEFFWLAPLIFLGVIVLRKYFSWKTVVLFLATSLLAIVPLLFFNNSLYGEPWKTGYNITSPTFLENNSSQIDEDESLDQNPTIVSSTSLLSAISLPFGWHPRTAVRHIFDYGLLMFWWLTIPAAVGFFLLWPRKKDQAKVKDFHGFYLMTFVFSVLWFGLIYGSWTIHDNPDLAAVAIVNSYTRYWLPVFVLSTPLVALVLVKLMVTVKKFGRLLALAGLLVIVGLSFNSVFFSSNDSLWPMRQRLIGAATTHNRLLELTEIDSVIVVDRADKLFFPDRRVRYPLRDESTYTLMPQIVELAPLYYFGITFPEIDLEYLNGEKLKALGLQINFIENFGIESLYRITALE
ncbi:MAG: hypothetical protein UX09_C0002G0020 [Candidatus Uhrbacteria bacterium GW2011_GWE2_45_35]|uniref:HIN-200 domain-containing protein n=2 Tax=Candidatus Uhriibacteriota TaxID=1752732 RepID=A0A0G1MIX5_9BACT|nr:MAG: hypothetical protein UW63_C0004G0005 [Candidatus Uhrbacteria bacterium GW2011_GWF2_44_350]KKU09177.1 MAG: hypothetical protein UX09_C0002G0020 [Candidatus Uhrbacteria bacterium GW2011_GWE2_45_35]HBR80108.1 hypothetical protein [Candidatus Uhrbacteria bacterium]HCU31210.1 hypothetical protein [Candidatus Uhrbacteria bacterium]